MSSSPTRLRSVRQSAPPAGPQLDDVDRRLLAHLQTDARASYARLAETSGLSPAAVRLRVQRLHRDGIVTSVGVVHPELLGITTVASVCLSASHNVEGIAERLAALPQVTFVVISASRFTIVADVMCRSDQELIATLEQILEVDGVTTLESVKHLDRVKSATTAPHDDLRLTGPLDETDFAILRELEADGRASYADLAAGAGLSHAATRVRVQGLLTSQAVRVLALIDPMALGVGELYGFAICVGGKARAVASDISALAGIELVAITAGPWDVLGTVRVSSDAEAAVMFDEIRSVRGVRTFESFAHLRIVKEAYPRLEPSTPSAG
jgi:DNA-binding Lrp family transcriptional regulator